MAGHTIPDCYDPIYQAEQMALQQDKLMENTCCCHLCRRTMYPGDKIHVASCFVVCPSCLEELQENIEII